MGKRKYAHVEEYEPAILQMREEGKTRREIAEHLGLTMKQVKGWIDRYNRKQRNLAAGIPPKPKERPRQRPLSIANASLVCDGSPANNVAALRAATLLFYSALGLPPPSLLGRRLWGRRRL